MTQYIHGSCGFSSNRGTPTILYEDNIACMAQLKGGCIKEDGTKHISPKFVFTHDLDKCGDGNVQRIHSKDNLVDLFIKALPTTMLERLRCNIGMQ
jgi:hypothetical protein